MSALGVKDVTSGYGDVQILWGVSLWLEEGKLTSLVGANGSGKTTLLRAIMGTIPVWQGSVLFHDQDITRMSPHRKAQMGLVLIMEKGEIVLCELIILSRYGNDQTFPGNAGQFHDSGVIVINMLENIETDGAVERFIRDGKLDYVGLEIGTVRIIFSGDIQVDLMKVDPGSLHSPCFQKANVSTATTPNVKHTCACQAGLEERNPFRVQIRCYRRPLELTGIFQCIEIFHGHPSHPSQCGSGNCLEIHFMCPSCCFSP